MTTAQKTAKANFKKAIEYRKKTGVSLKEAFAHVYGKKVGEVKKTAAIMRDRKYRSNEKHELAYKRKSSPKNPRYKSKYKQKVGALPIGFTGKIVGVPFKVVNQFDIYGEVNAIVENTDTGKKIIVIDGKASTKDLAEKFFTHIKMNVDYEKNEIPKDTFARISKFVIGLNKEVKDYNAGKKQTIKKQPLIIAAKKITTVKKSPSTKKSKVVKIKKTATKKSSSSGSKKLTYVGVRKLESGVSRYQYKLAGLGSVIYGIISGSKYSQLAQQLILENIDSDGYGVNIKTDIDKIKFLKKTFLDEYGWAVGRMGLQSAVESWLRGLPSSLTLPFYNDEILEVAKQWGSLPINATEKQEDKILNNYWKLMAANVVKLFRKV
jgi:hypothetical protein